MGGIQLEERGRIRKVTGLGIVGGEEWRGGGSEMWSLGLWGWGFASDEGHVLTGAGPFFILKSKQAACWGLGGYGKGGNSDANQAGAHFPF